MPQLAHCAKHRLELNNNLAWRLQQQHQQLTHNSGSINGRYDDNHVQLNDIGTNAHLVFLAYITAGHSLKYIIEQISTICIRAAPSRVVCVIARLHMLAQHYTYVAASQRAFPVNESIHTQANIKCTNGNARARV